MANTSGHSEEQNAYRKGTSKDGVQEILGRNIWEIGLKMLISFVRKELGYI